MNVIIKKCPQGICSQELKDYLDELADTIEQMMVDIGEENIADDLMKTIQGDK